MKLHRKFITTATLLLLIVVSFFGIHAISAAEKQITFKVNNIGQEIEGGLEVDLYQVANVRWDGSAAEYLFTPVEGFGKFFNKSDAFEPDPDNPDVYHFDTSNLIKIYFLMKKHLKMIPLSMIVLRCF